MRTAAARRVRGFTLLELLVALAIFALLSIMAYGNLQVVLDTKQRVETRADLLAELQLTFTLIGRDLEQAVSRPIRDEFGDRAATMIGDGSQLEFTRAGWRNPAGLRRSELQRVGYLLEDEELRRLNWAVLDRTQGSEARDTVLLTGVEEFGMRFLNAQGEWLSFWPAPGADPQTTPALPSAIEVTVVTEHWGSVTRLFRVVPPPVVQPQPVPPGGAPGVPGAPEVPDT